MSLRTAAMLCLIGFLLIAEPFCAPVAAAGLPTAGNVYYNRATTTYPVMNAATSQSSSFWRSYVGADNNSLYNVAPAFHLLDGSGAADLPNYLTFSSSFRHKDNDHTYQVYYDYQIESALHAAAQKGDLKVAFVANLTNDRHWNFDRHWDTWTAYPTTWVGTVDRDLIVHDSGDYDSDTTETMGRNQFVAIGAEPWNDRLEFGALGQACSCGSSKVSNISIILADTVGPRVTAITVNRRAGDGSLQPTTSANAGDLLYITLQFNEQIRFAGDQAMSLQDAPTLRMQLKRIDDNAREIGAVAEAKLSSLDQDTLTFALDVPESLQATRGTVTTNHYLYEIEPYLNQTTWISSDDQFALKLFGKTTSQVNYLGYSAKTTSLIVDLAGNPLDIAGSTRSLQSAVYLDTVAPTVTKLDIARADKASTETTRSDVFAHVGEKVGFFVQFSEEISFQRKSDGQMVRPEYPCLDDAGRILTNCRNMQYIASDTFIRLQADLNVSQGGKPVKAVAKYVTTVRNGVNGCLVSRVYFETTVPISGDMTPVTYGGEDLPIAINRIYLLDGYENNGDYAFTDARGNPYQPVELVNTAARIMPSQQLWLDTAAPTATTDLTAGGSGYVPLTYGLGESSTAFCFPLFVSETEGASEEFISGTNGVTGYFVWRDEADLPLPYTEKYAFEYAVTGSSERPADDAYLPALTYGKYPFLQIDSGSYLHIRFLDGVEYNFARSQLVIYPVDNAGNQGETAFTIDYTMDRVNPTISQTRSSTQYFGTNAGWIYTSIELRDVSRLSLAEYQWTDLGGQPTGIWNPVTSYSTGTYGRYQTMRFSLERGNLKTGVNHRYTLHIRGTDACGQVATASFDFQLNLSYPVCNLDFVTNPAEPNAQHTLLLLPGSSSDKMAEMVWVMIEQPKYCHPESTSTWYWMRRVSPATLGSAVNLLAVDQNATGWTQCEYTGTTVQMWRDAATISDPNTWRPAYLYPSYAMNETNKAWFYAYMHQYQQLTIKVIARPDWQYYVTDLIFYDEIYSQKSYTLNYASDLQIGDSGTINRISIAPESVVAPVSYDLSEVLTGSPAELSMPRSLDGATFTVSLGNARVPAYGLNDIDFASEDTLFALYRTGVGASETPVFKTQLVAKASQQIAIPAGVATASGSYKVVVSVKAKASDHVDRQEYDRILIDTRQADTYGVTEVTTRQVLDADTAPVAASTAYNIARDERPSEIFVSAAAGAEQSIQFTAAVDSLTIAGQPHYATYLKVWNETANGLAADDPLYIAAANCAWVYLPGQRQYQTALLTSSSRAAILADLASTQAAVAACIPILPGENLIKYQLAFPGGYTTPVQTLLLQAGSDVPTIDLQLTPDGSAGQTTKSDVVAKLSALGSSLVSPDTLELGFALPVGAVDDGTLRAAFLANRQVTLTENGDYYFYAFDKYHNCGYERVAVRYIDKAGPVLAVTDRSDSEMNRFAFEVELQDESDLANCQLYFQFDDAYCAVLGVEPGTSFAVPPAAEWVAHDVSQSGLSAASTAASGSGTKVVTFSGAYRYDRAAGAPATAARTITIYAVDGAGNKSGQWLDGDGDGSLEWYGYSSTLELANQPTAYVGAELAAGGIAATFSRPVILRTPDEATQNPVYSYTKTGLPYYTNGVYAVDYTDIFGDRYQEQITIDQYAALYACTVAVSETAPTNGDVQVVLNAAFNQAVSLQLPDSVVGGQIIPQVNEAGEVVGAEITMQANGTITYGLQPRDTAYPTVTRTIQISNIDKVAPEVTLSWVYTADVTAGQTAGEVIVSLRSNEELQALQGTGTTHTFSLSNQQPYTFYYADLAGNCGQVTATLPEEIVRPDLIDTDAIAPDYELSVYRAVNGVSVKVAGCSRAEYEALPDQAAAFPPFSGMLQIRFAVYDQNQTELSIQGGSPTGVVVSGSTVTVVDNVDCTVVIADANGNQTLVPLRITSADNTPPVGIVTYVRTAPYVIRGYLTLTDAGGGAVSLQSTSGVRIETTGEHQGEYYHEFLDNESFTFIFVDQAGNTGATVASVTSLDMTPPSGGISQWVPYYVDADGLAHPGMLSDRPTNADVSVYVQFNKSIQALTVEMRSGSRSDISLSQTEDSATVVFRQNAALELGFTALNGRSSRLALAVDIIDTAAPVITMSRISADRAAETYAFTASEPVFFHDGDDVAQAGTSFRKVFQLNGSYDLRFTDLAGNSTVKQVTVSGIDRTPPSLTITGLPDSSDSARHNHPLVISASSNEAGTIAFRGVVHGVSAGQSVSLGIDYNGTYEIVATDQAGLLTRYAFTVNCIDRESPKIRVPQDTLLVRAGTAEAEFRTMVRAVVQVTDNSDPSPEVEILWDSLAEDLRTPGDYRCSIVATDDAGNWASAETRVRVYGQDELQLWVNGTLARSNGTTFVGGQGARVLSVTVENLPAGSGGEEPYQLYWKSGLCTAGQMKNATLFEGAS